MKGSSGFQHNPVPSGSSPCEQRHIQPKVIADGQVLQCVNCKAIGTYDESLLSQPPTWPQATGPFERPTFATTSVEQMFA